MRPTGSRNIISILVFCLLSLRQDPELSYRPTVYPDGSMAKTPTAEKPKKRSPTPRRRHMANSDVDRIVLVVRHWPRAPMTWEAIRAALAADLRVATGARGKSAVTWSRQALAANDRIKVAYRERRDELAAKGKKKRRPVDPEATVLRQRVETLEIEVKTLREENDALREKYRALLTNRSTGRPEAEIEAPLPKKVDRTDRQD